MAKFDITDWSDFVRGVANPKDEETMRQLLAPTDPDAAETTKVVESLRRVANVGLADAENPVPAHAVRIAKTIASSRQPLDRRDQRQSMRRRLRCRVTFDSLLQPAPAGTRDLDRSHRTMVFEADSYRVDLRLEHELEPRSAVAVGQVTQPDEQQDPLAKIPVLVFAGQDEIDRTLTSRFGEFHFEGLPRQPLDLCLLIGEDFVELPLDLENSQTEEVGR